MKVICAAVVEDPRSQENLCKCVDILGGVPNKSGDTICVEYDGDKARADQFIELFGHYYQHEIHAIA